MSSSPAVSATSAITNPLYTPELTILLPVHNEAQSIGGVLQDFHNEVVQPVGAELLVCEDGSADGSKDVLKRLAKTLRMRLVFGDSRKGYARAVRDGLHQVESPLVFFADSDGQYDPRDFWKLWSQLDGNDMVIGRKVKRSEETYRTVLSQGFHILARALTGVPLRDMDCGFRLIRREVVEQVLPDVSSLKYSFWAEFSILAYRRGFRILEVPVSHRPRLNGSTSIYSWKKLPKILLVQFVGLLNLARRLTRQAKLERASPPRAAAGS
jgi:glycosyltransferase involved in cell wall biosynthesis